MSKALPRMDDLARRLISLEAGRVGADDPRESPALRACDRLRVPLANLMGVVGFASLASRALAMARAEIPPLAVVKVRTDGSLEGFEEFGRNGGSESVDRAGEILLTRLVGLLATFIGEPLTVRLLNDVWPDASADGTEPIEEEHR